MIFQSNFEARISSKMLINRAMVLQEMNRSTTRIKATLSLESVSASFRTIENRIMQVLIRMSVTSGPETTFIQTDTVQSLPMAKKIEYRYL